MAVLVLCYEKCSTCKKALDWLCAQGVSYTVRDIVGERPNEAELTQWITESHLPVKRFFNTSGLKYKALGLKEKLAVGSVTNMYSIVETMAGASNIIKP